MTLFNFSSVLCFLVVVNIFKFLDKAEKEFKRYHQRSMYAHVNWYDKSSSSSKKSAYQAEIEKKCKGRTDLLLYIP